MEKDYLELQSKAFAAPGSALVEVRLVRSARTEYPVACLINCRCALAWEAEAPWSRWNGICHTLYDMVIATFLPTATAAAVLLGKHMSVLQVRQLREELLTARRERAVGEAREAELRRELSSLKRQASKKMKMLS